MKRDQDLYAPLGEKLTQPSEHWRSLEQKDRPLPVEETTNEFPQGLSEPEAAGVRRRDLLKMGGAASLLAAVACVRRPEEEILPYTRQPEQVIPGVRLMYATAMPRSEGAVGLIVESHTGRPTKIEGNPKHPSSLGSSDIWAQADIIRLYDPDRARGPLQGGKQVGWDAFDAFANDHFGKLKGTGAGLAFLVEDDSAPTFKRLLNVAKASFPQAQIFKWDPLASDGAMVGAELAFGPGARVHRDLTKAQVILALDSNFLIEGPDHIRLSRQYAKRRELMKSEDAAQMNRLYVAEGTFSSTGANADHRVRVSSGEGVNLLRAIAAELSSKHGIALGDLGAGATAPAGSEKFVAAVAKDLASSRGNCAVFVGERQPAAVQALGLAIASALGAGNTGAMSVTRLPEVTAPRQSGTEQLAALTRGLNDGTIHTVVIFDANPVYTAPGALGFTDALAKAKTVVHAGVMPDETAAKAHWHVPSTHFLESWGDATAFDGTVSLIQPLIFPIFGARAGTSLLAQLAGHPERHDRKLVEETWRGQGGALADVKAWMRSLTDGVVANTAHAATPAPAANAAAVSSALATVKAATPTKEALELVAQRGHLLDGRLSNVSWLMELPDSMTKLSWDNAILMAPKLALELGIGSGVSKNNYEADEVELTAGGRTLKGPVFILPGLAQNTLAINQGYGRTTGGVASGIGVNVNPFLADGTGVVQGVTLKKTGKTVNLCSTQDHFSVPADPFKQMTFLQMTAAEGKDRALGLAPRPLLRTGEADQVAKGDFSFAREGDMPANLVQLKTPKDPQGPAEPVKPIQPHQAVHYEGQQWGMTIDLSTCIGCNACAVACIAENNIPTVGREQVLLGRELHWLRVDRYYQGDIDNPQAAHQPVPCMHCENAPCEPVCPVSATVHDDEGLNTMAYNRCIGTRYCNNNCPYKVRRFNYLDFSVTGDLYRDPVANERWKSLKMQRNPDVTVRYRGVMEKCTYCTQRIDEAKIAAKRAGLDKGKLPDGAVVPACAQACPTQAIAFGNINDPSSRVHQLKVSPRNYEMLQELNTRPRTTYLARVKNENEELA